MPLAEFLENIHDTKVVLYTIGIASVLVVLLMLGCYIYTKVKISGENIVPYRNSIWAEIFTHRNTDGSFGFYVPPVVVLPIAFSVFFYIFSFWANEYVEYGRYDHNTVQLEMGVNTVQTEKIKLMLADEILFKIKNTSPVHPVKYEIRCVVPPGKNTLQTKFKRSSGNYIIEHYKLLKSGYLKPHQWVQVRETATKEKELPAATYSCYIVLENVKKQGEGTATIERIEHPMPWW